MVARVCTVVRSVWARKSVLIGIFFFLPYSCRLPAEELNSQEVRTAIRKGVEWLEGQAPFNQGSYSPYGPAALATLALLSAGGDPNSQAIANALDQIISTSPLAMSHYREKTYAISLQTMAMVAAGPAFYKKNAYQTRIQENADWLAAAQGPEGAWGYNEKDGQINDNSNSQFAVLALDAAKAGGAKIAPEVFEKALNYFIAYQVADGTWGYLGRSINGNPYPAMTAAGVSSLILLRKHVVQSHESIRNGKPEGCGNQPGNEALRKGIQALSTELTNKPSLISYQDNPWSRMGYFYFMYGLERAGRLSGYQYFGSVDWYERGAKEILKAKNPNDNSWDDVINTSFALLFLCKGRAPVLVNKIYYNDGLNDDQDLTNLMEVISEKKDKLVVWQLINPETATVEQMLQAPIMYLSGHQAPKFSPAAVVKIRQYLDSGGYLYADACCGSKEFRQGFEGLMRQVFGENGPPLVELPKSHEIYFGYKKGSEISPNLLPLYGVDVGCRTIVVFSPNDVSCFWNQMSQQPADPGVVLARQFGQNLIDYFIEEELPQDKFVKRLKVSALNLSQEKPKRNELTLAQLVHAGGYNDGAQTALIELAKFLNMENALPGHPLATNKIPRDVLPELPDQVSPMPFLYMQGSRTLPRPNEDVKATLSRHINEGGFLFANALGGSKKFDTSFKEFISDILPEAPLKPIPTTDDIYSARVRGSVFRGNPGFDLSKVSYNRGLADLLPGRPTMGYPFLEGANLHGRWVVVYSKYDIGCSLARSLREHSPGYRTSSAQKISANIVLYATTP